MSFLKRYFFNDASPMVRIAKTRILQEKDMLDLPQDIDPRILSLDLNKVNWTSPHRHIYSLLLALKRYLARGYSWYFASAIFSLLSPILIHRFVGLISQGVNKQTLPQTLLVGALLGICGFLTGFCIQHFFMTTLRSNQLITNLLNEKIFRYSLKLSMQARQKNQLGDIVNYMSSDSESIADFPSIFADLSYAIFMIVAIVALLFYYIGWSTLAAIAVLVTLAPLTKFISRSFTKLDDEMMSHRDRRVTLMSQVLNAIRVVKYFAWESSVSEEVHEVRAKELAARRLLARAETFSSLAYVGVSTFVLFVALAVHAWRGQTLDAALIFTCISLFGLLEEPFGQLSRLISRYTQALVGARRILSFLSQEEVDDKKGRLDQSGQSAGLQVSHLSVKYEGAEEPVLQDFSFTVAPGKSLAIVGPVGSGKSSLIYSLLGELPLQSGTIQYTGLASEDLRPRVAYVPQEAYIVNASLLENLKFGEDVSGEEVRRAVHNACLDKDLKEWKGGLRTEIGEKGVNLSGGQKQRVALARASLSRPQVILLDDPLSAVDAETEELLCERLLFGAWKDKTVITATHRLEHLARFDQVLYMEKGRILGLAPFAELVQTCPEFKIFFAEHAKTQGEDSTSAKAGSEALAAKEPAAVAEHAESRVTEDEDREVGAVKSTIYWDYISSLGGENKLTRPWILILLFASAAGTTVFPMAQRAWFSYYTAHENDWQALAAVGIYGVLGLLVLTASMLDNLFWLSRGIRAGKNMHDKMLQSILKAPIRFFDSTPVGRILQRFSRDIESVDIYLQWSFSSAVNCAFQVLSSLFLILGLMPLMIVVIGPVMVLYYFLQRDYRRPAREAKRLDSISRSPRYAHFKESLQGLVVIRGFSKSEWFLQNFYDKLAHSQRMLYSAYMLNRWFSSRIPAIGGVISTATAVGVSISAYYGLMSAGTAGLLMTYALSFWGSLNWGVRIFADIESRMTSIERLKFFANLPSEKDTLVTLSQSLPTNWPERGQILVRDLQVRYATHLPLVLKGVSFEVEAGTRVGIIGRTGSGKSTFFQSLFRFIEAEQGGIWIDGVNIAGVSLERLRRSLAIIPQDPTLFMGSIRSNLDRYNEYSNEEVIAALKNAAIWEHVESLPQGLASMVTEGGLNFSQGQRQLLCLARALLTQARVIVMDEATASVDVQTDALLQRVIRESCQGVTMLIIAHRLGTIADCDQIVEISAGLVKSIRRPEEVTAEEIEQSLV